MSACGVHFGTPRHPLVARLDLGRPERPLLDLIRRLSSSQPIFAPMTERVLAVDYGERRVGLALSNPETGFVSGLPTLDRGQIGEKRLAAEIARLAGEHEAVRILLGVPYTLEGTTGPAALRVQAFRNRLILATRLPVEEWDERLTTEAARRRLRELGYSERSMRDKLDQLSAVLMLEQYLRLRAGNARVDEES